MHATVNKKKWPVLITSPLILFMFIFNHFRGCRLLIDSDRYLYQRSLKVTSLTNLAIPLEFIHLLTTLSHKSSRRQVAWTKYISIAAFQWLLTCIKKKLLVWWACVPVLKKYTAFVPSSSKHCSNLILFTLYDTNTEALNLFMFNVVSIPKAIS